MSGSGPRGRRPIRASVARTLSERARAQAADGPTESNAAAPGVDPLGFVDALRAALGQLGDLAAAAKQASGQRDFEIGGKTGKMVFGVSIRSADAGRGTGVPAADLFGHVPQPGMPADAPAPRQPLVDVFAEPERIVVVAEIPGASPADVTCRVMDGALLIDVTGAARFSKRVELPDAVDAGSLQTTCANGVLEATLRRARGGAA
jgi:HSP20 family protein